MEGINLVGANQWQTLQMQETSRPAVQPQVKVAEPDPRLLASQQPGVQTSTETARAMHLEPIFDHVDLSLKDALAEHGPGGEAHGDASPDEESSEPARLDTGAVFADFAQARDWALALSSQELRDTVGAFHFALTVRSILASLSPSAPGRMGSYARQAWLTATGVHLLGKTLADAARHLEEAQVEAGGKLLAVLLGASEEVPVWSALLGLAVGELGREERLSDLARDLHAIATHLNRLGTDPPPEG